MRDEAEKRAVITVLARVNGNIVKAAEVLGVSRPTLYDLMHKFGSNRGARRERRRCRGDRHEQTGRNDTR